jgi:hypothetical protein
MQCRQLAQLHELLMGWLGPKRLAEERKVTTSATNDRLFDDHPDMVTMAEASCSRETPTDWGRSWVSPRCSPEECCRKCVEAQQQPGDV